HEQADGPLAGVREAEIDGGRARRGDAVAAVRLAGHRVVEPDAVLPVVVARAAVQDHGVGIEVPDLRIDLHGRVVHIGGQVGVLDLAPIVVVAPACVAAGFPVPVCAGVHPTVVE